ncbi:unnamed protein product [Mytilus edulis]|uniref:Uncharacterized protein n=1 Tax=Mytilus edulis TaxID=6550 RepID=A0A8S3R6Z2_MYTED|nr:unnamed protein product [Mytilus edulis]
MGIDSYFYIDDSLLQAENFDLAIQNTERVKTFIESVGFDINIEKSVFIPTNRIIFLGYIIDSVLFKVFLPEEKVQKIIELSKKMLKAHKVSIRSLAQLTGLYSSAHYAVQYAHLFHRYLDLDKTQALHASNNNFNSFLNISVEGKSEIVWWLENVKTVNGRPIRNDSPSYYLHTDASLNGWGAVFHEKQTQGHWSLEEQCLHINILELKAIYFSIISLCCHIERTHICVKSDSSTAVNYINNQGGSVLPLLEITKQIWHWCIKNKVLLSAVHIPGKENIIPDNLSRNFNDTSEWKLNESVFNEVTKHFFIPDTDLFASRLNKQLNNFVSWFPDPDAYATDAFSFSLHKLYPYIFPPFSQISRVLQKIEDDQVSRAILIVPVWTTQLWYPKLLKALIDFPVKLPQLSNLLTLAHNNQSHTMNTRKMFLIACLVSGNISLIKVFQTKLQKSFLNLGESQPMFSMNTLGEARFCGVIQDKLVPLLHLTLKAVTSCSIARWLKLVLSNAGINVLKFKAHSYRSASSSAAKRAGISLNDILKTANWASAQTFKKFYYECSYPYRRVGKGCYLIQKDKVSGDTAFAKCLRRGAYLANFETLNEAMLMKYELLKMKTGVHYYVGGRNINRYKTGGDWRWIKKDGKMVKMTYFAFDNGEPNGTFNGAQDCMFFLASRGYRFHAVWCAMGGLLGGYICEK